MSIPTRWRVIREYKEIRHLADPPGDEKGAFRQVSTCWYVSGTILIFLTANKEV